MIGVEETVARLREAAESALTEKAAPDTRDWTRRMLGALAELGRERGLLVEPDPPTGTKKAEFLWDLSISSWPSWKGPRSSYSYPDYFESALRPPFAPKLHLVAESEWGRVKDRRISSRAVMEDFAKILAARSPLKVMIFSYFVETGGSSVNATFGGLTQLMRKLIDASGDDAAYVLFGLAWNADRHEVEIVHPAR